MTDHSNFQTQLDFLIPSLGHLRNIANLVRFDSIPYDLDIALTHLVESLDAVSRLSFYYKGDVYESDTDQES